MDARGTPRSLFFFFFPLSPSFFPLPPLSCFSPLYFLPLSLLFSFSLSFSLRFTTEMVLPPPPFFPWHYGDIHRRPRDQQRWSIRRKGWSETRIAETWELEPGDRLSHHAEGADAGHEASASQAEHSPGKRREGTIRMGWHLERGTRVDATGRRDFFSVDDLVENSECSVILRCVDR